MGKKTGVKKEVVKTQEPSTSSSTSSSKKNRKRTMDETDKGQKGKKLKTDFISKRRQKAKKSTINDLPPEMLMEVLKYLSTSDLFAYRLVNQKWNGVATEILQSRPDIEIKFDFSKDTGNFKFTGNNNNNSNWNILNFKACFYKSKNFPYTRFCFQKIENSTFNNKHWTKFISDFEEHIKCLKLSINPFWINENTDLTLLTRKLRDLLLLPKLEEFGLELAHVETETSSTIQLFPNNSKPKLKEANRLPHLKVLHLNEEMFSDWPEIITDLLVAAVNLKKLVYFNKFGSYEVLNNFYLLQSLGKLECVQSAVIDPVDFFSKGKELYNNSTTPLKFKLKFLNLDLETLYGKKELWWDATIFIINLLESSKNTLIAMAMHSLGFLDNLQLPKFSKLRSIYTEEDEEFTQVPELLFPSGINLMEIFPVLDCLELAIPWSTAFPAEGDEILSFCIPTLKTLELLTNEITKTEVAQISVVCPNLKIFKISKNGYPPLENFPKVGRAIWTHLKKLRTLELKVRADSPKDAFPAFDSCITGFSKADCERLYDLLLASQLLKKRGSRGKVPKSELKAERKYPSILDLKDLEYFELRVVCCDWDSQSKMKPDLTQKGPTWVSEKCTLDLMDNLFYEIEKEVDDYDDGETSG